jgi:hypothetical protein
MLRECGMSRSTTTRFRSAVLAVAALIFGARATFSQEPDSNAAVANTVSAVRPCGACISAYRAGLTPAVAVAWQDTARRKAIEYSDAYHTRLTIHRIASYAEFPLFIAEYIVGTKVQNDERDNPGIESPSKGTHTLIASGLEGLFAINTVTGLWNLIESRHDPAGRTRRWVHGILMLAADAGFLATAGAGGSARGGGTNADHHRSLAIGSASVATVATLMMWIWKD